MNGIFNSSLEATIKDLLLAHHLVSHWTVVPGARLMSSAKGVCLVSRLMLRVRWDCRP